MKNLFKHTESYNTVWSAREQDLVRDGMITGFKAGTFIGTVACGCIWLGSIAIKEIFKKQPDEGEA